MCSCSPVWVLKDGSQGRFSRLLLLARTRQVPVRMRAGRGHSKLYRRTGLVWRTSPAPTSAESSNFTWRTCRAETFVHHVVNTAGQAPTYNQATVLLIVRIIAKTVRKIANAVRIIATTVRIIATTALLTAPQPIARAKPVPLAAVRC
jgi:hypothetical protein